MTTDSNIQGREANAHNAGWFARNGPIAARVLMGLIFLIFGLNMLLNFLPQPSKPLPEGATDLAGALVRSGYLFQLTAWTEVICGALLLMNLFVPLALAFIAPVVVNIVAFHVFLAPSGLGVAVVVLALNLYLACAYRRAYRPMLAARIRL